jgi:hypothetical protein
VNLLDLLFWRERKRSYDRAREYEHSRNLNTLQSQEDAFGEAARQLTGERNVCAVSGGTDGDRGSSRTRGRAGRGVPVPRVSDRFAAPLFMG